MGKKIKEKLQPSWEIYNRILWDPSFKTALFWVGYADRMSSTGTREKNILDWNEEDIPWSRVQYFRCEDVLVWDRVKRINLFKTNQIPAVALKIQQTVSATNTALAVGMIPKNIYKYNVQTQQWQAYTENIAVNNIDTLRVLTWNVLTDKYDSDRIYSQNRFDEFIPQFEAANPDILVLQEVDMPMLKRLLNSDWAKGYFISEIQRHPDYYHQELTILSRYPFTLEIFPFSKRKRFPIATLNINGQVLTIAGVHLNSNSSVNAAQTRERQLEALFAHLNNQEGAAWIIGDFNLRKGEEPDFLNGEYEDAWLAVHPQKSGFTFDPEGNILAKMTSKTGKGGRLDRMWQLNGEQLFWKPRQATVLHQKTNEGKPLSDHYGLLVKWEWQQQIEKMQQWWDHLEPVRHTAIVLLPPKELWEPIQKLRRVFDKNHLRWMPHITLIYGFLQDKYFEDVVPEIARVLQSLKPFEIQLNQYGFFENQSNTVGFLKPEGDQGALNYLYKTLRALFPFSNHMVSADFNPHLTIGRFKSEEEARADLPTWKPRRFEACSIACISRVGDTDFEIRYAIELGTGNYQKQVPCAVEERSLIQPIDYQCIKDENIDLVLALIEEACGEALGNPTKLYPTGSFALGTHGKGSDIDCITLIPNDADRLGFLKTTGEILTLLGGKVRLVADAQIPILKIVLESVEVDLQCALCKNYPQKLESIQPDDYRMFDAESWQVISGYLEVEAIRKAVHRKLLWSDFVLLVKLVKQWAKLQGVYGNAFGYLGGYSWTVLVACFVKHTGNLGYKWNLVEWMGGFFEYLNAWAMERAQTLGAGISESALHPKKDRWPVFTTIYPQYNSAKNVIYSTQNVLKAAINRAAKGGWKDWFKPDVEKFSKMIAISIQTQEPELKEEVKGWIESCLIGWLITGEQEYNLKFRPFPEWKDEYLTIGLLNYSEQEPLAAFFDDWRLAFLQAFKGLAVQILFELE